MNQPHPPVHLPSKGQASSRGKVAVDRRTFMFLLKCSNLTHHLQAKGIYAHPHLPDYVLPREERISWTTLSTGTKGTPAPKSSAQFPLEGASEGLEGDGTLANQGKVADATSAIRRCSMSLFTTTDRPQPEIATSRATSTKKVTGESTRIFDQTLAATTKPRSSTSKMMVCLRSDHRVFIM